ncbi:MAG TPA: hypothetical protein GX691_02715 [Clostridia bacterium]|jgi:hypothetical protein|nr:hypothetical protein [Clostridia bacterium]
MSDCPSLVKCPFFNEKMDKMPAMANIYKAKYCKDDFNACARWKVASALGSESVPNDLFPNQTDRVVEIVSGN